MNYDFLINKAESFWAASKPLPIDLFYQMIGAGLDVDALEKSFNLTKQYNDEYRQKTIQGHQSNHP